MRLALIIWIITYSLGSQAQEFTGLKKINGTKLYFKITGRGEPLVVIHGGPGMSHDYLLPHLNGLSKDVKLVLYDQRASGRSWLPSKDSLSLKYFTEDLEAIRKDLGVEKLNILAHSWGAVVAVNYGIAYPSNVGKMILCNPVPLSKEYDQAMNEAQGARMNSADSTDRSIIIGSKAYRDKKPEAYRKLQLLSFRNSFYKQKNYDKLRITIPANYLAAQQALYAGLGPDLRDYNYYDELAAFSFPLLVTYGESDVVPVEALNRICEKVPRCTVEDFRRSGHFIFIEEQKKFLSAVNSFLRN